MALDVGFGGWTSEHVGVGMDEGQVMTLLLGDSYLQHPYKVIRRRAHITLFMRRA